MLGIVAIHPHAFWLTLGGVLLAIEMLGTAGYLLWSGIAALLTGLLTWLIPASWEVQGICFSLLALTAVFVWYRWLNYRQQTEPQIYLNQRGEQLIGQTLLLTEAMKNGRGTVRIADSSWPVQATEDYPEGTRVKVTGIEGITLTITAC